MLSLRTVCVCVCVRFSAKGTNQSWAQTMNQAQPSAKADKHTLAHTRVDTRETLNICAPHNTDCQALVRTTSPPQRAGGRGGGV